MSVTQLPLVDSRGNTFPALFKALTLLDYRTSGAEYERVADVSFNRAETWITSLEVRISPTYVPVGDLQVIVWDSVNATGNPAAVGAGDKIPDLRTLDSQPLSPGDLFVYTAPVSLNRIVEGLHIPLGFHLQSGYRVQVVDTNTLLPIESAARFVTTFVSIPSHP